MKNMPATDTSDNYTFVDASILLEMLLQRSRCTEVEKILGSADMQSFARQR